METCLAGLDIGTSGKSMVFDLQGNALGTDRNERFEPIPENVETYARLYKAFCRGYEGLDRSGVYAALADLQK